MKKEDIDPEVFEILQWWKKKKLNEGDDLDSSSLASDIEPTLPFPTKQKIVDYIIKGFPNFSDVSKEGQQCLFANWRHASHISDTFEYSMDRHDSKNHLLNNKNIQLGLKLANFLAQKTAEIGGNSAIFSMERVIAGFMRYNWDQLKKNGFDAPLVMPESFRQPEFLSLEFLDSQYGHDQMILKKDILAFLQAKTIREWIEKYTKMNPDEKGMLTPLRTSEWDEVLKKYPSLDIQKRIIPSDAAECIEQTKNFQEMLKAHPKGKVDGVFVDIDGTLFNNEGRFDIGLYDLLVAFLQYTKVTIFTGGDIKKQIERLKEKGVDTDKFPVVSKDKYHGYLFTGFIIDDTPPENQGFILLDPKRHYWKKINRPDIHVLHLAKFEEEIGKGKSFEEIVEDACLTSRAEETRVRVCDSIRAGGREKTIQYWDKTRAGELRRAAAVEVYKARHPRPSESQKLSGIEPPPDREKMVQTLRDFYAKNPSQRPGYPPLRSSKNGERG